MTLWMGDLEVKIMHLGRGHTKGDTVVWLPQQKILFSGDLVEADAACYTGDAYLADWPADAGCAGRTCSQQKMIPGRGPALMNPAEEVQQGLAYTRDFVSRPCTAARRRPSLHGMNLEGLRWRIRARTDGPEICPACSSTSTACPSTSRAPTTRPPASAIRASGRRSAIRRCGMRLQA
jgi:glyoxylase-like metal-dependent hydrolase (beta-lactamase superfamily II)